MTAASFGPVYRTAHRAVLPRTRRKLLVCGDGSLQQGRRATDEAYKYLGLEQNQGPLFYIRMK